MPKLQIIKMDEEIEKITSNFPSRIPFEKKKPKKNICSFSIKLFLVRCMILTMFFVFAFSFIN